jgi:hypothetical protein
MTRPIISFRPPGWLTAVLAAALFPGPAPNPPRTAQDALGLFVSAINAERESRDLPPVRSHEGLTSMARQRAEEISGSDELEFAPLSGEDLLARARWADYAGPLVQELVARWEQQPCEIVEHWNEDVKPWEIYRRHEVRDVGIGQGVLGGLPVSVLVVGVPAPEDLARAHEPGVAPHEWLTARLIRTVNERRLRAALPSFTPSEALDEEARRIAQEILVHPPASETGTVQPAVSGAAAVYFRGSGPNVRAVDPRRGPTRGPVYAAHDVAVRIWFEKHRALVAGRKGGAAGAGLASRGQAERPPGSSWWVQTVPTAPAPCPAPTRLARLLPVPIPRPPRRCVGHRDPS